MLACCWISWAETRLRPSERAIFSAAAAAADVRWHSHTRAHLAGTISGGTSEICKLQTRTTSYKHVRGHFRERIISYRLSALLNQSISTGYSHPHPWESDNRYSSFYVTYTVRRFRGRLSKGVEGRYYPITNTAKHTNKTIHISHRMNAYMTENKDWGP